MATMSNVDVCIRGAGAVGLSLALSLARQGLRAGLVDAEPRLGETANAPAATDLRAYALNAASRQLLTDLKVWDALPIDAVTPVYDMHIEGDSASTAAGTAAAGTLEFSA